MPGHEAFRAALAATLAWEGVYSDDPQDPGGETFRGIARRRHPGWSGWRKVDAEKLARGAWRDRLAADPELGRMVEAFYRSEFWLPLRGDELAAAAGLAVAAKVFDAAVNLGQRRAVELYQGALAAHGAALAVDGRMGAETLAAAGAMGPAVVPALRAAIAGYYVGLIAGQPGLAYYARGWRRRALA